MRQAVLTAAVAAVGILVAGCGAGQALPGSAAAERTTAVPGGETATAAPGGEQTASGLTLATAVVAELGTIITDGEGMTLYRFDKDTAKPSKSTCEQECAVAWPPAIVDDADDLQVGGVSPDLVGTVERADGAAQLTIAGWPAYYYSKDDAAGDTNGQGAGEKWFAFTDSGRKAVGTTQGAEKLTVMEIAGLGSVLTDREGMTLYRFDKDTPDPSASVCAGDCAKTWPPVLIAEGTEVELDVDGAKVGRVTRADGTEQVTVGGWPLYRYSGDKIPCDAEGHGVGGTWFAAAPDGRKAG